MKITAQRLRNLTTGILHTNMNDVYKDIEAITCHKGIMTHQLPAAIYAMQPYLDKQVSQKKFWVGNHDPYHVGEADIEPMSPEEQKKFFRLFIVHTQNGAR